MEGVEEGVRELLIDAWRTERGIIPIGMPLCIEGFEGVRDEGKEDKEACRVRLLLPLAVVPLVDGRYERTEVMVSFEAPEKPKVSCNVDPHTRPMSG